MLVSNMTKNSSIHHVLVILLGITLVILSVTGFSVPVLAVSPGTFIDDFVSAGSGGLTDPDGVVFGPDGNIYVSSVGTNEVLRYDGATGTFIDAFVSAGSGGLSIPRNLIFGPDGSLYVSSENTDEVLRYNGATGTFIDDFVSVGSGGLDNPKGLVFGPDGNLYVSSNQNQKVKRYDGTTGVFIDTFVSAGSGGLNWPHSLVFGPDGNLYVSSWGTDEVLRYDGATGTFIDAFVSAGSGGLNNPDGFEFGPDGNFYVVSILTDQVIRYDGSTGMFIDIFVNTGSGGLNEPDDIEFGADGKLYVTSEFTDEVLQYEGPFGVASMCKGFPATIEGTSGNDVLDGTSADDVIVGFDGDDVINGKGGNDVICGGSGDDKIHGGAGDDVIDAGDGDNKIYGEQGADTITAGSGDDKIYGGDGDDIIDAGDGDNYIEGNQKSDTITAGSGDDKIYGDSGDDCINSIGGIDVIDGGPGNNSINEGSCDIIPILSIVSPSDGDSFVEGTLITLSGTANDSEDGDISTNITWILDMGVIGTGSTISSSVIPVGVHTIDASVTDSDGHTSTRSITISVNLMGYPMISINQPVDSFVAVDGTAISFSGSATDLEDGGISNDISWSSDIDGYLGVDSFSTSTLSVGTHTITAKVTDSDGNTSTASIMITIENPIVIEEATTLICHFPPGNPRNFHEIMIPPNELLTHKSHGDKVGHCQDKEKERIEIIKIKEQRAEIRDKNELKEKRIELKEIKNELKNLKVIDGEDKEEIKTLVKDIKVIIEKLNENPKYAKEQKRILKEELKDTKAEIEKNMTPLEKITKHKVDSKVYALSKSDDPKFAAKKLGLDYEDEKTTIAIKLSNVNKKILRELGSVGTINAKNDDYVQLNVHLNELPKLRQIQGIENIRAPFAAIQYEEELSEGVYFMNADIAQYEGITGKDVKVAVLDLSFTNNPKILDNIVEAKSFRTGVNVFPVQWQGTEALHGTAVAEIIADVAPDVELYLYSMETDIEFAAAVDEAISKKLDVIVMSAGWPNFPTDGTSHITKKIEEAVDHGIVFVVPAGNFANKHWEGNFIDSNFNNWHEFSSSDEGLSFTVTEERVENGKPIVVHLMWDAGNSDVSDFDLVLVDPLGQIVDFSANEQLTKSDVSFEYIYHIPELEGTYSLGVLYAGDISIVSQRPSATLEIFSINDEIEHPIAQSSVSVPADAEGAIVVGAINHIDGVLEPFSSQGPTNNGKLAPHVVGPDGVTTLALDGKPFFGTSATTPYVAGLAALILETNPDISPKELLTKIQENTDSSLSSLKNGYDYSSGYGAANAFFLIDQEVLG